jgi:hypothetical protein
MDIMTPPWSHNRKISNFLKKSKISSVERVKKSNVITPRNDCGLQLVGDDLIQEESKVANVINDFFVTKWRAKRPDPLSKRADCSNTLLQLKTVSAYQVLQAINKLESKASSGLDQNKLQSLEGRSRVDKGNLLPPTMKNIPSQGFRV